MQYKGILIFVVDTGTPLPYYRHCLYPCNCKVIPKYMYSLHLRGTVYKVTVSWLIMEHKECDM